MNDSLGKTAERKIKEWLDKPEKGYSFDRIPDQMNGFYQSCNICDFTLFKSPYMYYIESKATYKDRFDFNMITNYQKKHLFEKSKIDHVYGCIIILFADYKRAFVINIKHIIELENSGKHSLNIKKIDDWNIPYFEIQTIPNNRKKLLDYTGDFIVPEFIKGDNYEESN